MCAAERAPDAARRYGTIVVIGGGCYGSYYLRQLRRARAAGALRWERLLIVDHDASCRAQAEISAGEEHPAPDDTRLVVAEWGAFVDEWLPDAGDDDALVPSPLMPHLLFDWLVGRARARWPHRRVERAPLDRPPSVPWQRAAPGGTHFVSFAEWMCPVNCIEPPQCPVIRGPRSWSLPPAVRAYVEAERRRGRPLHGPLLFHCTHRAYGVGMIDVRDVTAADRAVVAAGTSEAARVLVATVSHCHGAMDLMTIGASERSAGAREAPAASGPAR